MKLEGQFLVQLPRDQVWAMLNDVEVLKRALPGCLELERTDTGYNAKIGLAIGPVKAAFSGQVEITDIEENVGYTLVGQGSGGVAGFAKGTTHVRLTDAEGGTQLDYTTEVAIGGKLAQLGSRLIVSTSKKLTVKFFNEFAKIAEERSEVA